MKKKKMKKKKKKRKKKRKKRKKKRKKRKKKKSSEDMKLYISINVSDSLLFFFLQQRVCSKTGTLVGRFSVPEDRG